MTGATEAALVSALEAKIALLERKFSDLEGKYTALHEASATANHDTKLSKDNIENNAVAEAPASLNGENKVDSEVEEPSPHSRVKIVKITRDPKTGDTIEVPEASQSSKAEKSANHAIVLRKTIYSKYSSDNGTSEIDILDSNLWELLKDYLGHYPYHIFRGSPVTLRSPYEAIVFEWDTLAAAAAEIPKDDKDRQTREDLKHLLDIISGGSSGDEKLDSYFKVRNVYKEQNNVRFEDLWTIFPPGTLVYGKPFQEQDQLFLVYDNDTIWPELDHVTQKQLPWNMTCWIYDWSGEQFKRMAYTLQIEHFEGHRPITALPFYPFNQQLPEVQYDSIKEKLVARGRDFRMLCEAKDGSRLFEYKGIAIPEARSFTKFAHDEDNQSHASSDSELLLLRRHLSTIQSSGVQLPKKNNIDGRIMVDYASFFQYGPSAARCGALKRQLDVLDCNCKDCESNKGLRRRYRTHFDMPQAQKKTWHDEQYMLCPPRVLGYILKEKQWAQFRVSNVREVPPQRPGPASSFDRLRLADEEETKNLLNDLISTHISSTVQREGADDSSDKSLEVDDIIPGKGKGLVILLYGPPGVGKTSTAEIVATATRKPLFPISVADVGTQARHVESNLSRIFSLAASWQAILLIDEADVFLESRGNGGSTSTEKNALVSVFLRALEYYAGIMFLTTNQIAQFDVAIPSRIHIAIQYKHLTPLQMKEIYKGFLDPLDAKGVIDDYDEILGWLKEDVYRLDFDGRQIRNTVVTALGLARAERNRGKGKGKLSKKHLKAVVFNTRDFKTEFNVAYRRYIDGQEKMIK